MPIAKRALFRPNPTLATCHHGRMMTACSVHFEVMPFLLIGIRPSGSETSDQDPSSPFTPSNPAGISARGTPLTRSPSPNQINHRAPRSLSPPGYIAPSLPLFSVLGGFTIWESRSPPLSVTTITSLTRSLSPTWPPQPPPLSPMAEKERDASGWADGWIPRA